ncbi:helix-turn-helix domain-containing protein [Streptomyces sp. NPDC097619]|uniref:TetR/AcrR family transcriptional regulator n=1 Tax=Streptomyces sp. NPDC097619 TaxID=3157228 RepID=UPI00333106EF
MDLPVVPLGRPRPERADAVRNREHLLATVREMLAEQGPEAVTMDGLAERAGLGKGTVFRRFGTRAGIFRALLDADETEFQRRVLEGPPPLGPGAGPEERLTAFGRHRIAFLFAHHAVARAAVDRGLTVPAGEAPFSRQHIRVLLGLAVPDLPHLDHLAVQLSAALEGPTLLYVALPRTPAEPPEGTAAAFADTWTHLVERLLRP